MQSAAITPNLPYSTIGLHRTNLCIGQICRLELAQFHKAVECTLCPPITVALYFASRGISSFFVFERLVRPYTRTDPPQTADLRCALYSCARGVAICGSGNGRWQQIWGDGLRANALW